MNKQLLKKYSITLILILIVSVSNVLFSQSSYKITVKTNAFKDTICILGNYYGKFQYPKDTARFDNKGVAVFESKSKSLERGVYFLIFPNKKYLDFIVNKEQVISFDVDTNDVVKNTKVSGSKENQLFYEYNREAAVLGAQYESLRKLEEKYKDSNKDSVVIIKEKMTALNLKMQDIKERFIITNPQTLVAKIFLLTKDPDLPEAPIKSDGTEDKDFVYYFYKEHFWDNMDFSDDALIRTPVFHSRLERYLTQVLVQHPDSLIKDIDVLVRMTEKTPEIFKYVVWFITYHFEISQIMGHDAVFVHMIDKYYKTGRAFWASESVTKKIIERADKLSPILIGKVAPNMALIDTSLNAYVQLWSIKAPYTIMIFWDPDCGHCKKEIEQLNSFYITDGKPFGIEIYSVCTDTSLTTWKSKIVEKGISDWINVNSTQSALGHYQELYDVYATPLIYILDKEKRIIAKKISAENVSAFLRQYDKSFKREEKDEKL